MSETLNIFEKASRKQLRFVSVKGKVTIEDLWNLPLTSKDKMSLDEIAKTVNQDVKSNEEESFVKKNRVNSTDTLKLQIIKHIIAIRLSEIEDKQNALIKKEKKAKILDLIANKEAESDAGKSVEELTKMLNDL